MGRSKVFWILAPPLFAAGLGVSAFLILGGGERAPVPRMDPATPTLAELPSSAVTLSVTYDPSDLLDALEQAVPLRIGSLGQRLVHPLDPALEYSFQADREPFRSELRGDTVQLTAIIRYGGQVWYASPLGIELTTACGLPEGGEPAPRAQVRVSLPLEIDEDWTVQSRIALDGVEPVGPNDRCRVSVLQLEMDVTEIILEEAKGWLAEQIALADRTLSGIDLPLYLEPYWEMIRDPIPLGDDTWLTLNPEALTVGAMEGVGPDGRTLQAELEVQARPRIVLGERPDPSGSPGQELPPLLTSDRAESGVELTHRDLDEIIVEGTAEYGAMSALATRMIYGTTLTVAGQSLQIRAVTVSGTGEGKLSLDLEVEGAMRGHVHLVGTPVFEASSGRITMPDLELSVTTRNLLARSAAWILNAGFPGYLSRLVAWPVNEVLAQGRALAHQGLNRQLSGDARLEGSMGTVEVTSVAATDELLLFRAMVQANTSLVIGEE